jgi:nuclear pore complex protein Nup133
MFSTNVVSGSALPNFRNPRRRQRTTSDEGVKLPNAKRQRSTLRQQGHGTSAANRQDEEFVEPELQREAPVTFSELPLRGPKKTEKHGSRAGVSDLLVSIQNSNAIILAWDSLDELEC